MKNIKGLKGLIVFGICLWAVVVVTYAKQIKDGALFPSPIPMDSASCGGPTSSGGSQ